MRPAQSKIHHLSYQIQDSLSYIHLRQIQHNLISM
nr:MAG TPA: hypothetical protein [Caudoviricetes sp.]